MIIAVVGATASGKTTKAIELAQELNGVIINCDKFQLYRDLKILSAYPTDEKQSLVPHRLFGVLSYSENISVFEWAKLATIEIREAQQSGHQPIVVGGTGMYLNILINGISPLPNIPDTVRMAGAELSRKDFDRMCQDVFSVTPDLNIRPCQHHQIIRAWEVLTTTGRPITYFYKQPKIEFIDDEWKFIYLNPPRNELYDNINKRFDLMLKRGAIDEVQVLLKKFEKIDNITDYHIFKTIGAGEIIKYLNGKLSYNDMQILVKQHSRNYAKRQITWFNKYIRSSRYTLPA